jgi:cyclase
MSAKRTVRSTQYRFSELAEGVVFAEASVGGTALSNSGIVDLGGSSFVFDTGLTLHAARELVRAAPILTGGPVTLSANSHWHMDHLLGNQLFASRPIYATRRTVEILLERRAELERELTREGLEADLKQLEGQKGAVSDPTPEQRAEYDTALRIHRTLLDEVLDLRLTPPSGTFEGALDLPGERGARLVTFGGGHTESDALLVLPHDRVVFAGDLVVSGHHPNLLSGNPEQWLNILGAIEELRPERIVTGHGPAGDLDTVGEMRSYLTHLLAQASTTCPVEVPAPFRDWSGCSQYEQNLKFVRSRASRPGS